MFDNARYYDAAFDRQDFCVSFRRQAQALVIILRPRLSDAEYRILKQWADEELEAWQLDCLGNDTLKPPPPLPILIKW